MIKDKLAKRRIYRIYVSEKLSPQWNAAFPDCRLVRVYLGSCIVGQCRDQSELYGLLRRVSDMGLTLEAVIMEGSIIQFTFEAQNYNQE